MAAHFRAFVEEVRAASDLVDVIGADVKLTAAGRALKGLSPFHQEKHPSFVVWPEDQRWHDFSGGGGLGGDVFAYVMQRDQVGFKEAVFSLAQLRGIRRPDQDEEAFRKELALLVERRDIERLLTQAAIYYHRVLPSRVRQEWYREHYGFTDETIGRLHLGWADGHLFRHFREELKVSRELALKTGLFVIVKKGKVEDFFRDRLVFPYWKAGQVVYFIARSTQYTGDEAWERSKYKKLLTHSERRRYVSPSVRNDTLYNEDAARGAEQVLITEGVTDCISAMQAGIPCISPVTTRFRKQDLPKLLRLTRSAQRVIICNDAEESGAGAAGALETAAALHAEGRDVRIAVLPRPEGTDKIDVNEFLKANAHEAFEAVLAEAPRYVEHLIEAIPQDTPAADLGRALEPVLEAACQAEDLERDAYLDAIVKRFGVRRRPLARQLKSVASELRRRKHAAEREKHPDRPVVQTNARQLRDLLDESRALVVKANTARVKAGAIETPTGDDPPLVFRRGGCVVYLKTEEESAPELAELTDTGMFGLLVRDADWIHVDKEDAQYPVSPPKDVPRDLMTFPPAGFPRVDSVITTPVFGKSGKLIAEPGLHESEHLWLQRDPDLRVPKVPEAPTSDDVDRARSIFLDDLFVDFPFVGEADRAHIMAAVLLPFVRRMVYGSTPLHVVESPSMGSGKSRLCHLTSIVCTGKGSDISTLPGYEEEVRKTLTAELLKACPIIVLDNAKEKKTIDSQALTAALTAPTWRSRILGKTEMIVLPNLAMWMLTGNNPRLSGELVRRSIRIRIKPDEDRPWLRTGFKHDPIIQWAREHRGELVHAALVLIQAWIAAGQPRGDKRLGSFEDWAAVMGGILAVAEVPGFLENLTEMYDDAEAGGDAWREFTKRWWEEFQDEPKRVVDLNELCESNALMTDTRGDGNDRSQQSRLGRALWGARDRFFGDLQIVVHRSKHRGRQYALRRAAKEAENAEPAEPADKAPTLEELPPALPAAQPLTGDICPWD